MVISSGTSFPFPYRPWLSAQLRALFPWACRNRSPVAMWASFNFFRHSCSPAFPYRPRRPKENNIHEDFLPVYAYLNEAFVAPHHQLRFQLLHGIQNHPDHDQQTHAGQLNDLDIRDFPGQKGTMATIARKRAPAQVIR